MTTEKTHSTIGVIGHVGAGKTTLSAAISRVLFRKYKLGSPVPIDEVNSPHEDIYRGVKILSSQIEAETPSRIFTLIDCQGYEDWAKTLIIGRPKLDGLILVIDNGPSLQARELLHLAEKIQIPSVVTFINKSDICTEEQLDDIEIDTDRVLAECGYNDSSILMGSAREALKAPGSEWGRKILDLIDNLNNQIPMKDDKATFLMPVEDVLTISGKGTVATGRIESGSIRTGDKVEILGIDDAVITTSVSSIHISGSMVEEAKQDDYIGVILDGISKEQITRGTVLATPDTIKLSRCFRAQLYALRPEEGGCKAPLVNALIAQFSIRTADYNGVSYLPEGTQSCLPGDFVEATIEVTKNVAVNLGLRFSVREKGRTIATGVVTDFTVIKVSATEWFDKGMAAYKEEDYKTALQCFINAGEQGDAVGQFNAGICYQNAKGTEKDFEKAAYWYAKAADQGYPSAQNNLGWFYANGYGVEKDRDEAFYWYMMAAEQGYKEGQFNLGECYYFGRGVQKDKAKAAIWFNKSAEQGFVNAQYKLGEIYEEGDGVTQDLKQAEKWYAKAADQGHAEARNKIAALRLLNLTEKEDSKKENINSKPDIKYREKEKTAPKPKEKEPETSAEEWNQKGKRYDNLRMYDKAFDCFQKAAEMGDVEGFRMIGLLYRFGNGTDKDLEKAVYWLTKAAEQGYSPAQYNLATLYADSKNNIYDVEKACYWYVKAAEKGHLYAQRDLVNHYFNGKGVPKDPQKAIDILTNLAEKGDDNSQWQLGNIFLKGKYVEKDTKKAIYWYTKSAEQGYEYAQIDLADIYQKGEVVEKNTEKAIYWYTKAAEQENYSAMLRLARIYEHGDGVKKNRQAAKSLYAKIVAKGYHSEAEEGLRRLWWVRKKEII